MIIVYTAIVNHGRDIGVLMLQWNKVTITSSQMTLHHYDVIVNMYRVFSIVVVVGVKEYPQASEVVAVTKNRACNRE